MKNYLLFLFLIPCVLLFGQDQKTFNNSLDLIIGVDRSYRSIHLDNEGSVPSIVTEARDRRERPSLSYRFGFNFNHQLEQKLFLKTGIRFVKSGYQTKRTELIFADQLDFSTGSLVIGPTSEAITWSQFKYQYFYLEIPINLRYVFFDKKIKLYAEAGLNPYYLIQQNRKFITNLKTEVLSDSMVEYRKLNFVGVIGFGAQKQLSNRLELFSQINLRRHFFGSTIDTSIKEYLTETGIEIGCRLKI